jgi:hypothetical protein
VCRWKRLVDMWKKRKGVKGFAVFLSRWCW